MSTLMSIATGNFTAAGSWSLCDPTSELDSEAATGLVGTGSLDSSAFTPGAITINALAVKLASRVASPTGTFTIELYNSTGAAVVANTTTTINVSDMHSAGNGWYVFPTASPILLLAATQYRIRVRSSVSNEISLYRDNTSNNWSRQLRTTTTQAPAATDKLIIAGEHTGAGTGNDFTITMNQTATTSYGAVAFPQSISVNKRSTLNYGSAASTNYYLKVKGKVQIFGGGTFNIGTVATPIPSSSSAVLEFDPTTNVDSGLIIDNGAAVVAQGAPITSIKTLLTSDVAAAATVLNVGSTAGWVAGNQIVIAATARSNGQVEKRTIQTVNSATQVTVTAGLSFSHTGVAPLQGEVGLIERNVKIRGISDTLQGYIEIRQTPTLDFDYVEFHRLGSGTSLKRGIDINVTTGSASFKYCSIHDFIVTNSMGFVLTNSAGNNIEVDENFFYNTYTSCIQYGATTGTNNTLRNNLVIYTNVGIAFSLGDAGIICTGNTVAAGGQGGFTVTEVGGFLSGFSNNIAHSCSGNGFNFSGTAGGITASNLTGWRNSGSGLVLTANANSLIFDNILILSSGGGTNIFLTTCANIIFRNLTAAGEAAFATTAGILFGTNTVNADIRFENSSLGVASGIMTSHTQDIQGASSYNQITLVNTILGSSAEVSNQNLMADGSYFRSQKHDQISGNHKVWMRNGTLSSDIVIFDSSPSQRLTPINATGKLKSSSFFAAIDTGEAATVSVKVRESVAGDGTAYNGNRARLIVKANPSLGINADTVIATATAASNGAFETISGSTINVTDSGILEFFVDCDGTTGWINIDTWTAPTAKMTLGLGYWNDGNSFAYGDNNPAGGMIQSRVFTGF